MLYVHYGYGLALAAEADRRLALKAHCVIGVQWGMHVLLIASFVVMIETIFEYVRNQLSLARLYMCE